MTLTQLISPLSAFTVVVCCLTGCSKQAGGPQQMPPPQVIVAEVKTQKVVESLSRVANVQANEMIEIQTEADGIVQEILFEEGQRVEKGDLLVRLDQTKFATALAQTEANFQLSKANFERSKQLFEDKLISQQDFDQAAAAYQANLANLEYAKRLLEDARIIAPFSGIMSSRNVSPGQFITKNTIVSWLIDLDPAKVEFHLPERYLGQVRTNQQINMTVAAYPGRTFTGRVFFVSPYVDPTNRTALIKASIPNPDFALKPGMFASLDLTLTVRESSLVIPESALTQILPNGKATVFTVDNSGTAHQKTIHTGVRLVGLIEVLEGLEAGDKVIVEGLQKTVPGAPVRIAPSIQDQPASVAATDNSK